MFSRYFACNTSSQSVRKSRVSSLNSIVFSFQAQSQRKQSWCSELFYQTYPVSVARSLDKDAEAKEKRQVREHQYFCTEFKVTCSQLICVSEVSPSDQEAHRVFKSQETDLCHSCTMESNILLLHDFTKIFTYLDKKRGCPASYYPEYAHRFICIHLHFAL